MADLPGMLIGALLTIGVFSYLIGDNPMLRLILQLFVGLAAGYAAAVAFFQVLLPQLILPAVFGSMGQRLFLVLPLILAALLLTKLSTRLGRLGNLAVAFLAGLGVAAVLRGAVLGTLFPQVGASMQVLPPTASPEALINGLLLVLGTAAALVYFQFRAAAPGEENAPLSVFSRVSGMVGGWFIAAALGALYAGVLGASLAALVGRLDSLWNFVQTLLGSA